MGRVLTQSYRCRWADLDLLAISDHLDKLVRLKTENRQLLTRIKAFADMLEMLGDGAKIGV